MKERSGGREGEMDEASVKDRNMEEANEEPINEETPSEPLNEFDAQPDALTDEQIRALEPENSATDSDTSTSETLAYVFALSAVSRKGSKK